MCSVTQKKKNIVRTVNASHTQCSVGHEILKRKIRCTFFFFFFLLVRQGNWTMEAGGLTRLQKMKESEEEEPSKQCCHPMVDWGKIEIKYLCSAFTPTQCSFRDFEGH